MFAPHSQPPPVPEGGPAPRPPPSRHTWELLSPRGSSADFPQTEIQLAEVFHLARTIFLFEFANELPALRHQEASHKTWTPSFS